MPGGAGSCPVAAAVRPRRRCHHRGAVLGRAPPGAVTGRGRPARRVVAGREGVRTSARPVVALSASSGPPWGCRPTGRADVRCPGVRGIQVSGRTGRWCPRRCRRAVRAALDLEWLGVAGRPRVGRSGSTCRRGPRAAWSPTWIGPNGKGRGRHWPWLARTRVDRSPGRRVAGVPAAASPGRRADMGAVQGGVPAGWWGSTDGAGAHRPRRASWAGRRRGARPWAWTKRW